MSTKITKEQWKRSHVNTEEVMNLPDNVSVSDFRFEKLNRILSESEEPQSWCNWELQEVGVPVVLMDEDGATISEKTTFTGINDRAYLTFSYKSVPDSLHLEDSYKAKPDLSRRGRWVIDPPLKGKPEGLRDEAIVAYWVAGIYDDTLQVAEIGNWKYITAFTILEA